MLQDKRKDLDAEKQKKLLNKMIEDLSAQNPDLYYQPTGHIARLIKSHIDNVGKGGAKLYAEERELMSKLSEKDIEVLLSYN